LGYAEKSNMTLEVGTNLAASAGAVNFMSHKALPALVCSGEDEATDWSVFGVSFRSPAGYVLDKYRLYSGDMALRFTRARADDPEDGSPARLTVRQVYPATVALKRRPLERWLDRPPFQTHRRLARGHRAERWSLVAGDGDRREGRRRRGWKRFAFPFGAIAARAVDTAGVVDTRLDRLLIAEAEGGATGGSDFVKEALEHMNWAYPERAG
jgi:hypothetical protein